MSARPPYHGFLGSWVLIPESCDYEQSEPPQSGTYCIEEVAEGLRFEIRWTDSAGQEQRASFSGVPDGKPRPFAGGELADAMTISAPSERELWSTATYREERRMVAQLQLDETGLSSSSSSPSGRSSDARWETNWPPWVPTGSGCSPETGPG